MQVDILDYYYNFSNVFEFGMLLLFLVLDHRSSVLYLFSLDFVIYYSNSIFYQDYSVLFHTLALTSINVFWFFDIHSQSQFISRLFCTMLHVDLLLHPSNPNLYQNYFVPRYIWIPWYTKPIPIYLRIILYHVTHWLYDK